MTAARRTPSRRNNLLRALAAAGFVVLIVAATALVVRLESDGHRLVVHAQIDQHGVLVAAGTATPADPAGTGNAICQVQIKEFDTGGDPARVNEFAPQIVADLYTVGLIGPTFSGVAEATGAFFEDNGLPAATATASRSTLSEKGWTTFFRAVASDEAQGEAVANFVKDGLGHRTVCVVSDNSPYGNAMAQAATATLSERSRPSASDQPH